MATHTTKIVKPYDFSATSSLTVSERLARSLETARSLVISNGYQRLSDFPCVPTVGASEAEIAQLESELGIPLPREYRQFLAVCRYLKIEDGREVGGLDHNGVYVTEIPWVSDEHRADVPYLVFANYWRFADGDQLLFDLSDATHPVIAYLHEHGPLYESFAASFSLALWRLVHETQHQA